MNPLLTLGNYGLNIFQTFPQTIPFFGIYFGLLTVNYWLIAFGVSAVFSNGMNKLIKILMKLLYKSVGKDTLPLLGTGSRPSQAHDCSAFTDCKKCHLRPHSFGMPSGHSQMGWFFFTYGSLFLADHLLKSEYVTVSNSKYWFIGGSFFLLLMAIALSFSRVYIKCHTIEQVLVGVLTGVLFGLFSYWVSRRIIDRDSNIDIFKKPNIIFSKQN